MGILPTSVRNFNHSAGKVESGDYLLGILKRRGAKPQVKGVPSGAPLLFLWRSGTGSMAAGQNYPIRKHCLSRPESWRHLFARRPRHPYPFPAPRPYLPLALRSTRTLFIHRCTSEPQVDPGPSYGVVERLNI